MRSRPELLLGKSGFAEAEDCQVGPGARLVFHQIPTSRSGQLLELLDRDEQVVEPASSQVSPASAETNLTRMSATVSIPFVVREVEGIVGGGGVDASPDDLSSRSSQFRQVREKAAAIVQALQQPIVVPAQQERGYCQAVQRSADGDFALSPNCELSTQNRRSVRGFPATLEPRSPVRTS